MEIRLNQRLTPAERVRLSKSLVKGYGSGASIRDLAAANNTSIGRVRRLLVEAGVELRPRGGARKASR